MPARLNRGDLCVPCVHEISPTGMRNTTTGGLPARPARYKLGWRIAQVTLGIVLAGLVIAILLLRKRRRS